jgi:pantoate--beta-alanine ligase
MELIKNIEKMKAVSHRARQEGKTIALVPTMGALHEGHLTLMDYARARADWVVVSIFVNPIQFGPKEDFERYPRDLETDLLLSEKRGVDIVFAPHTREMYPEDFQTQVTVEKVTRPLCGAFRPGHFPGVTTVVLKLFNIVNPHLAVFGQKDYQQWVVIRQMVRDLNLDIEVAGVPTVREKDGLAMSSRNVYLSPEERDSALSLFKALNQARTLFRRGERRASALLKKVRETIASHPGTRIEYAQICDPLTLEEITQIHNRALLALAVWVGSTRLIDNCILEEIQS